jgi:hypothetical protein
VHGRASHFRIRVDFVREEIRACISLDEGTSQDVAAAVRRHTAPPVLVNKVCGVLARDFSAIASGEPRHLVKIIMDAGPVQTRPPGSIAASAHSGAAQSLLRSVAMRVKEWVLVRLADFFRNNAPELVARTEEPKDGISIKFGFQRVQGLAELRRVLKGGEPSPLHRWPEQVPPADVRVYAGHE